MKLTNYIVTIFAALALVLTPIHADAQGKSQKKHGKAHKHDRKAGKSKHAKAKARGHGYFHEHGYTRLEIPPGHFPAPGECRIWFPNRPPGHQPPAGNCWPVPEGAWIIRHPRQMPDDVFVYVYEPHNPRNLLVVGQFEIDSGLFVKVVLER